MYVKKKISTINIVIKDVAFMEDTFYICNKFFFPTLSFQLFILFYF